MKNCFGQDRTSGIPPTSLTFCSLLTLWAHKECCAHVCAHAYTHAHIALHPHTIPTTEREGQKNGRRTGGLCNIAARRGPWIICCVQNSFLRAWLPQPRLLARASGAFLCCAEWAACSAEDAPFQPSRLQGLPCICEVFASTGIFWPFAARPMTSRLLLLMVDYGIWIKAEVKKKISKF